MSTFAKLSGRLRPQVASQRSSPSSCSERSSSHAPRTAKAKNNRENALLDEARAALESNHDTLLPPTPPRALALDADADVDDYTCPSCEAVQDDITPDENGMVFCAECGQRLDDLE